MIRNTKLKTFTFLARVFHIHNQTLKITNSFTSLLATAAQLATMSKKFLR